MLFLLLLQSGKRRRFPDFVMWEWENMDDTYEQSRRKIVVPVWEKANLTLEEAAAYSGIGIHKLRELSNDKHCEFVLFVGSKRLIKRKLFDAWIEDKYSL